MRRFTVANRTGNQEARSRAAFARRVCSPLRPCSAQLADSQRSGDADATPARVPAAAQAVRPNAIPCFAAAPHALHIACQVLWALLWVVAAGLRRALWRTLRARLRRPAASPARAAVPAPLRAPACLIHAVRALHACCKLNKAPPAIA
jgi:hypothetical protein